MVTRMQALKEKEGTLEKKDAKKEVKQAKGNPEEIAKVKKEIEEYLGKLKDEFKYSKQDIAKDPDMLDLQKKLKDLGGK
jgi:predicted transcriptional regulator